MGEVKVKLQLENAFDRRQVRHGLLKEEEVRHLETYAVVDTGAVMLMLPQDQVETLGLEELDRVIVTYADERREERPVAGTLSMIVGNRKATLDCIVGPPASEPLLGQVPLEIMDLLVDCGRQELIPRPESPYLPMLKMK